MKKAVEIARFIFMCFLTACVFMALFLNIHNEDWIALLKSLLSLALGAASVPLIDLLKWRWNDIFRKEK